MTVKQRRDRLQESVNWNTREAQEYEAEGLTDAAETSREIAQRSQAALDRLNENNPGKINPAK